MFCRMMLNIDNNKQCSSCVAFWTLLSIVVIFGAFVFNFSGQRLSPEISDWGAFGSYVGGTMGFISAFLVYMT